MIQRKPGQELPINSDLSEWITQQALADELNKKIQVIHNWVQRNKIDWAYLPEVK
jgi:hypothetical protein